MSTCAYCGGVAPPAADYCGPPCRQAAYRDRAVPGVPLSERDRRALAPLLCDLRAHVAQGGGVTSLRRLERAVSAEPRAVARLLSWLAPELVERLRSGGGPC